MTPVYLAENSIDAHLIKNLLQQSDIEAFVMGEHLQSGAGELQAFGAVKVAVNSEFVAKAKDIIREWEVNQKSQEALNSNAITNPPYQPKTSRLLLVLASFSGLVVGALLTYWLLLIPVYDGGMDLNGDGKFDEHWYYANDVLSRTEFDSNFDGKIDMVYEYDRFGTVESARQDADFDGALDSKFSFYQGSITYAHIDTNGDGSSEIIEEYEHGILQQTKYYNPQTKKLTRIEYYNPFRIIRAEVDADGDGVFEKVFEYHESGDIVPLN